jgi:hypothetical protein
MQRHQLMRWGQYYASWGTREEVVSRAVKFERRPWWWLRLCGWDVGLECRVGPVIQWVIEAPDKELTTPGE